MVFPQGWLDGETKAQIVIRQDSSTRKALSLNSRKMTMATLSWKSVLAVVGRAEGEVDTDGKDGWTKREGERERET